VGLTYRDSGVDIDRGDTFVEVIKDKLHAQERDNIGLFGGLYDLGGLHYQNPVLVSGTDGVGTKLLLAKMAGLYNSIGIDLVAMCVNDVVTSGARPLFFLDYLATGRLDLTTASEVVDGILSGCRVSGCLLLGGETAEMPGVYGDGDYELAGFTVGIVEKERIINGKNISEGDLIVGISSSGIHSNGLSLARNALFNVRKYTPNQTVKPLKHSLIQELLIPTKIYVSAILDLIDCVPVKGLAHITGGGMYGNIKRVLPEGLDIRIDWGAISPQPIFDLIQRAAGVDEHEMRRTFNMGIGMAVIVASRDAGEVVAHLKGNGESARIIGEVLA
jgi:phosphoribosylformylglycinamidine cyclo-ligase